MKPHLASTSRQTQRAWNAEAIRRIEADFNRSADTHLVPLKMDEFPDILVYLKDETSHPTGSLKHRLARSLFLYALANGWLNDQCPVIEASSGSTAVSEAYFARLLGLSFIAVMPRATSPEKIAAIEFYGGRCHLVESACNMNAEAERLAQSVGGHFMDQFTYAERATDWRANNNIAESVFLQMRQEKHPIPHWIVCGAGTGGTAATLGRYVRYRQHGTKICCVDPERSVFFDYYRTVVEGDPQPALVNLEASRIEGIGRPKVELSFIAPCIDAMLKVPDDLALAGMRHVNRVLGRRVGGSTGTNFVGVLAAATAMREQGCCGSIVSILCDAGERYAHSYYSRDWYSRNDIPFEAADERLQAALKTGASLNLVAAGELCSIRK